jgi:hypothetical protein
MDGSLAVQRNLQRLYGGGRSGWPSPPKRLPPREIAELSIEPRASGFPSSFHAADVDDDDDDELPPPPQPRHVQFTGDSSDDDEPPPPQAKMPPPMAPPQRDQQTLARGSRALLGEAAVEALPAGESLQLRWLDKSNRCIESLHAVELAFDSAAQQVVFAHRESCRLALRDAIVRLRRVTDGEQPEEELSAAADLRIRAFLNPLTQSAWRSSPIPPRGSRPTTSSPIRTRSKSPPAPKPVTTSLGRRWKESLRE